MKDEARPAPVLTAETPKRLRLPGQAEIIKGVDIRIRRTHPALWRSLMVYATANILLGLNFAILQPTFLIYGRSNYWWAAVFLALGIAKVVFVNLYRKLRMVRITMAFEVAYTLFIALGTVEPFLHGKGSLQLPIVYVTLAMLELPLLLEPFLNPWTAKRD